MGAVTSVLHGSLTDHTCRYHRACLDESLQSMNAADVGEAPDVIADTALIHPLAQARALCPTDAVTCPRTNSRLLHSCLDPEWEDRCFEQQSLARCGMHALNNLVGGPQFTLGDLDRACSQVVAETGEPVTDHATNTGWFSHSVLGRVLQETIPPRWR